jgi:hypothetical protein
MDNGKLNTEQRKALVQIVNDSYKRRIDAQRDIYNDSVARVTKEVKDELGITAIDDQLKEFRQKINDLESDKERLGINKYNDQFLLGSRTKSVVDERLITERQKISDIEKEMDKDITKVWTAKEFSEIKSTIDRVLK